MFGFMAICRPMSSHFMKLFQEKNLSCNKVFLTFVKDTELAQENVVQIFFFFFNWYWLSHGWTIEAVMSMVPKFYWEK